MKSDTILKTRLLKSFLRQMVAMGIEILIYLRYDEYTLVRRDRIMAQDRFEMFVGLMGNASKSIQRMKSQNMKKYGLTSAHTNCICRLESAEPKGLTQVELVQQESMDASQISRVLRELLAKGYVQITGEEGRYRRRYTLTEQGMSIAREIRGIIININDFVSRSIPEEDIEVFYRTFRRICESLNQAEDVFAP